MFLRNKSFIASSGSFELAFSTDLEEEDSKAMLSESPSLLPPEPLFKALSYYFSSEGEKASAYCTELGIITTATTREDAVRSLNALVLYQINQW
jgi:hypothetical protein